MEAVVNFSISSNQANEGSEDKSWRVLDEFTIPSEPGNERQAMDRVVSAVNDLNLPQDRLERLKTAVAEATMNAMEHGNKYQPDLPVSIKVLAVPQALSVLITDQGGDKPIPDHVTPDLDAKLAGLQSPRGWGLFLIKSMVDEMNVSRDKNHHTVELIMRLEGVGNEHTTV
jgi:anti-sigma regulatory factor (Ser/Thr protein kinase)